MNNSLRNKVAAITDASSRLEHSIALQSAERGANLILIARREEKLLEVAAEAKELSRAEVWVYPTDVGKANQIEDTFEKTIVAVEQIDFLVNTAGFGDFDDFFGQNPRLITNMLQINVLGLIYSIRLITRVTVDQKSGQVINLGSMTGKIPTTKSTVYSVTRAAIIQFSSVLCLELKPFGIKIMTVNPGPVYTNFFNRADHTDDYVHSVQSFMLNPDDVVWQVVHYFGNDTHKLGLPLSLVAMTKLYNLSPSANDYLSMIFGSKE